MTDQKTQGKTEAKAPKARMVPTDVGFIDGDIPASTRQGYWAVQFEELKQYPGRTKKYEKVSQTTASYLKKRYGVIAVTRNNRNGKADLFVQCPGMKATNELGEEVMVVDEAKIAEIKVEHEESNDE